MRIVFDTAEIAFKANLLVKLIRNAFSSAHYEWSEEAEKETTRTLRAQQEALMVQAGMDVYSLNTGVVRATVDDTRIAVASSIDRDFTDCICIQWRGENDPKGTWRYGHFSPSRARILALHLIQRAEMIEQREGAFDIDIAPGTEACLAKRKAAADSKTQVVA